MTAILTEADKVSEQLQAAAKRAAPPKVAPKKRTKKS